MRSRPASLKRQRLLIRLVFHGAVIFVLSVITLIAAALEVDTVVAIFGLTLFAYLLTMRLNPIPIRLELALVWNHECVACGAVFDLVDTWSCRCGYVSWQPRHAFSPCPHCHGTFEFLQCPKCEQGVGV